MTESEKQLDYLVRNIKDGDLEKNFPMHDTACNCAVSMIKGDTTEFQEYIGLLNTMVKTMDPTLTSDDKSDLEKLKLVTVEFIGLGMLKGLKPKPLTEFISALTLEGVPFEDFILHNYKRLTHLQLKLLYILYNYTYAVGIISTDPTGPARPPRLDEAFKKHLDDIWRENRAEMEKKSFS